MEVQRGSEACGAPESAVLAQTGAVSSQRAGEPPVTFSFVTRQVASPSDPSRLEAN